ncbi:TonB-dependent receptor [Bacteroides fragilis]|nr:TonB-dependent receptor [Bacteroides fragilis]
MITSKIIVVEIIITSSDSPVIGIGESKPANETLVGKKSPALTDIGLDFTFSRTLGVTADYYIKNTSDILLGYNVPTETGITAAPSQNIGKVKIQVSNWL